MVYIQHPRTSGLRPAARLLRAAGLLEPATRPAHCLVNVMEIQCPSCQKRLSIGDQFANQMVKCPACNGVFMAPALAAAPAPPAIPVTAAQPDILPFTNDAPPPRTVEAATFNPQLPKGPPPPKYFVEEEPTGPIGEYTKTSTCHLRPDIVRWIAPVSLAIIFVVSFLNWLNVGVPLAGRNLWELAFGDIGSGGYIFYLLVTLFVALPLAWAKLLLEMNIIPTPAFLGPFWSWRTLLVVVVLVMAVLLPFIDLFRLSLIEKLDFSGLGMKLGVRLHFLAIVGYALELWLANRKKRRLPLPEMTTRW